MKPITHTLALTVLIAGSACAQIDKQPFGTADGKEISLYTLKNAAGMEVKISNYGGVITQIKVPDRNKKFDNVVLGFDNLEGYQTNTSYFGALIGQLRQPHRRRQISVGRPNGSDPH